MFMSVLVSVWLEVRSHRVVKRGVNKLYRRFRGQISFGFLLYPWIMRLYTRCTAMSKTNLLHKKDDEFAFQDTANIYIITFVKLPNGPKDIPRLILIT